MLTFQKVEPGEKKEERGGGGGQCRRSSPSGLHQKPKALDQPLLVHSSRVPGHSCLGNDQPTQPTKQPNKQSRGKNQPINQPSKQRKTNVFDQLSQINFDLYKNFRKFLCGDGKKLWFSSIFCMGSFWWLKATKLFKWSFCPPRSILSTQRILQMIPQV